MNRIYISTMPDAFERPGFFVQLATSREEHLCRDLYQVTMTWQIVYFAPLLSTGQPDVLNQLAISDSLKQALMDTITLTGPSGTKYQVINTEGGPRDAEVYITVTLQTELTRPKTSYDLMGEVHYEQEV
ncbi:MAG: hypothetical protein H0Z36_04615 [Thermosyntropha sp.]|nr:hypothetical protein [Thermosyntropha sp.]MBO8158830.1 hypothetical protein [Thermosyntropha sp.]